MRLSVYNVRENVLNIHFKINCMDLDGDVENKYLFNKMNVFYY